MHSAGRGAPPTINIDMSEEMIISEDYQRLLSASTTISYQDPPLMSALHYLEDWITVTNRHKTTTRKKNTRLRMRPDLITENGINM